MPRVEVVHWNPRTPIRSGRLWARVPLGPRVGNFGDLLGPIIVAALCGRFGLDIRRGTQRRRLVSVGSIMSFTRPGDVVWGTGVNGRELLRPLPSALDVRSVRGPRTRAHLIAQGIAVPPVYGDPGLLMNEIRPDLCNLARRGVTVCLNLNDATRLDVGTLPAGVTMLDPRSPLETCLRRITSSELVVGSGLHAIVLAEAFGIPARALPSLAEPSFKYEDHFEGTGRRFEPADDLGAALDLGGQSPPEFDRQALLEAFPRDLWHPQHG